MEGTTGELFISFHLHKLQDGNHRLKKNKYLRDLHQILHSSEGSSKHDCHHRTHMCHTHQSPLWCQKAGH